MFKKIALLLLCVCLVGTVGCKKKSELEVEKQPESSEVIVSETAPEPEVQLNVNPLTGLSDVSDEAINNKPVAITINNIKIAQPVQTGLNKADVIYETEVEGGITRLSGPF